MSDTKCPLCNNDCLVQKDFNKNYIIINCKQFNEITTIYIHNSVHSSTEMEIQKRYSMIYEYFLKQKFVDTAKSHIFFYESKNKPTNADDGILVDVSELMRGYPKNIGEKLDRIIVNISRRFPDIGQSFIFNSLPDSLIFMETDNISEKYTLGNYLKDRDLISPYHENHDNHQDYKLTAKAWELVAEQTKKQKEIDQGFIAMEISNRTEKINECFKIAIDDCGYMPRRIDEKEHNNQIVPEIFYEIGQSKFVVVDITYPNYGAYYEAGYAQALGKQVIICCRKNESECMGQKSHFDISQKNMIFWNDEDELIERLKKRIEATIGLNK
ncbi:MAG: hypothetical protein FWC26_12220 [Fibromonadales bacterium]|nr:hypothetical protein [Fibromonadales bacterium]